MPYFIHGGMYTTLVFNMQFSCYFIIYSLLFFSLSSYSVVSVHRLRASAIIATYGNALFKQWFTVFKPDILVKVLVGLIASLKCFFSWKERHEKEFFRIIERKSTTTKKLFYFYPFLTFNSKFIRFTSTKAYVLQLEMIKKSVILLDMEKVIKTKIYIRDVMIEVVILIFFLWQEESFTSLNWQFYRFFICFLFLLVKTLLATKKIWQHIFCTIEVPDFEKVCHRCFNIRYWPPPPQPRSILRTKKTKT